jgi:hypothetical protein
MSDMERELEEALHRALDPLSARPIPARRRVQARGGLRTVMGGAGAALTLKVLSGVAVAAAAVTIAGAAATNSLNPADWGQQVKQRVSDCKSQLAADQHGIGECVSSFASQHGAAVASAARQHGNGSGNGNGKADGAGNANGNGNGNGSANGHAKDKGKDHTPPAKSSSASPPTVEPEPIDIVGGHAPVNASPGP